MDVITTNSPGEMSKADTLRSFVTERLSAASREILAVVETIVAAYEEEASGFRQEITRQRRQLELLQPPLTVSTEGLQTSRNQGPAEDEESHECLKSLDLTGLSSSLGLQCHLAPRKPGRPQISKTLNTISLSVRILQDSSVNTLSRNVLKKSLMVSLKCPRGLKEADFLELLRSAVPQLSGHNKPFDILTSDKRRRLQPLKLNTVTPEEIHSNIKSLGPGRSIVYIRLKSQAEAQKETQRLQTGNISSDMLRRDETRPQTSSPFQEVRDNKSTSQLRFLETDEQPAEVSVAPSAAESESVTSDGKDGEREDVNDSDSSWRPDGEDERWRRSSKISEETETKTENSVAAFPCKVCGVSLRSEVLQVKHAWSHQEEAGSVCGVCGESVEVLTDHFQSRHRTEDCPVCGESFLSLKEHQAAQPPPSCDDGHRSFQSKASLEEHLHEADHKCPTCHEESRLEIQLKAHGRGHSKPKPYLCSVCGKFLSDSRSLSRHKMTHSGERPHRCQICGRGFKLHTTLRQHEKIHTNRERPYLCDVCCKRFLSSKQLAIHMRTHTNEKLFHCDECGKGFSTKGPLKIHMRVHTGETPYHCPFCSRAFKRKSNLDDHVGTHTGAKPHVCKICGKSCARKTYLTVHMRTHNGERPYKCSVCEKAFTQSHCLKTHLKSHS